MKKKYIASLILKQTSIESLKNLTCKYFRKL